MNLFVKFVSLLGKNITRPSSLPYSSTINIARNFK